MPRANLKAVKPQPDEDYDKLSPEDQDLHDAIASFGYRPRKTDDGWEAFKPGTSTVIGNCDSLDALLSAVKEAEPADGDDIRETDVVIREEARETDDDGNTFLPGAEETVRTVDIPELRQPSLDFHAYVTELEDAKDKVKEQRKLLTVLMEKHRDILPTDPETGYKFFRVINHDRPKDRTVQIDLVPKGEQIKSHIIEEEED